MQNKSYRERVLRCKLTVLIQLNDLHNPGQHGFRAGRSCLFQLLNHYDRIVESAENNHNADMICTEVSQAFEKCDQCVIAHKMCKMGIIGKMDRCICIILTKRSQLCFENQMISGASIVKSFLP